MDISGSDLLYTNLCRTRVDREFEGKRYFVGTERGSFEWSGGSGILRTRLKSAGLLASPDIGGTVSPV
jgi:hypothetical protein